MRQLRQAVAISSMLFVIYLLNARAIGSRDTRVTEAVAFSLAAFGRADVNAFPVLHEPGLARGYLTLRNDQVRSNYPVVPAIVGAPVYWMAMQTGLLPVHDPPQHRIEAAGKLTAAGATALACGVLFALLRRRLAAGVAGAVALAAGLATPLWSSASQALWSHAPGALALVTGWLLLAPAASDELGDAAPAYPAGRDAAAGALLAIAAACRPLLGFFLIGAAVSMLRTSRPSMPKAAQGAARRFTAFGAGAASILAALLAFNVFTHGDPSGGAATLESAEIHRMTHAVDSPWNANPLPGLFGILMSPNRGLLIYMPVIFVAAMGATRLARSRDGRWRIVLPTVAFLASWSTYAVWWGGHSYGPRYAADLAAPLALMAGAALEDPRRIGRYLKAAVVFALAWSVLVQALGAAAYPRGEWNGRPTDVDRAHHRLWDWRDSQIVRTTASLFGTP